MTVFCDTMFSRRVPSDRRPNRLARAVHHARTSGRPLVDLTITNPTTVGLRYPPELLLPLASQSALTYEPHPLGHPQARAAVAADFARRGIQIASDRIVLTASTSEAYSLLFKLLCDPVGDTVLVPIPSYPLFDHLTQLDGVTATPYALEYHGRWTLDAGSVDRAWTPGVRAVLAVSPNNPTGSVLSAPELEELGVRCAERDAALLIDEVFADFPLDEHTGLPPSAGALPPHTSAALTFRLGGLSKSAGLPQAKLGWIAVEGPAEQVGEALDRLELICDTYLSVSTPVQEAAGRLIAAGAGIRRQILDRVHTNYRELQRLASAHAAIEVPPVEAGWSAVVRVPSTRAEEDLLIDLIERDGVLAHPGFFFDFPHEAFVIVSLLPEPKEFSNGMQVILERAGA